MRALALAASLLAIPSLPVTASAAEPWAPPQLVPGSEGSLGQRPALFALPGGALVAWHAPSESCSTCTGVFAASIGGDGEPGRVAALLPNPTGGWKLRSTRTRMVAAGHQYGDPSRVEVRTGPAGAALGPPAGVGPVGTETDFALATNSRSAVLALRVVTTRGDSRVERIQLAPAPTARRFRRPEPIYRRRESGNVALAVAMNERGDAFVAWAGFRGEIRGRFRYASGRLGKVLELGSGSVWFSRLHVAVAEDRRVIVTWTDQELAADGPGVLSEGRIESAAVGRGGKVRFRLLDAYPDGGEAGDSAAAFTTDGRGLAVWDAPRAVRFARLGRERLGAAMTLDAAGDPGSIAFDALATGPRGTVVAAWSTDAGPRAAIIPQRGAPAAELVADQGNRAAVAIDPRSRRPLLAFFVRQPDGTDRVAVTARRTP